MQATLDKFGRVLIPKRLRERLGLQPNDVLELELEDGKLTLLPRRTPPPPRFAAKPASLRRKGRVLVVESEATADLGQALAHLREDRLEELFR
ncbi:MAG: AbrB/MazE/SpoVT family DNA-binding domain-containing protein [Armatimonadota bacterium]